jgi:Flp pilus assembly protein TadG
MSSMKGQRERLRSGERGSIIVMTAIFMLLFCVMLGLAIDVSRIYMVRAELQNAADAAALTAARELNGGTTGIDNAVTRANNIANTQGFGTPKAGVSIASVEFAINLDGTYWNAATNLATIKANATDIRFVRVTTQATTTNILFAVRVLGNTYAESRSAVAGMSVGINGICKYFNIALAVDPVTNPNYTWPTGTTQILKFHDNVGTTITLQNMQYIVLDTSWVSGGGHNETVDATADVNPHCIGLGDIVNFSKSPSANNPNGMSIGTNTRLDVYTPPITCNDVKPDLNVYGKNTGESITLLQYLNGAPTTAPTTCTSGQTARRLMIFPVINTVVNGPTSGQVQQLRAFFIKQPIDGTCDPNSPSGNKPCPQGTTAAGDMVVEYAGDNFVVGSGYYDPNGQQTNLTVAVLYK